jgi:opacity protein-like surface antigen
MKKIAIAASLLAFTSVFAGEKNWMQITSGDSNMPGRFSDFAIEGGIYFLDNLYARGQYIDSKESSGGFDNNAVYFSHLVIEAGFTTPINESTGLELGLIHQAVSYRNIEKGGVRLPGTYTDGRVTGEGFGIRLTHQPTITTELSLGYARMYYQSAANSVYQADLKHFFTTNIYGVAGYTETRTESFKGDSWKLGIGYRFN